MRQILKNIFLSCLVLIFLLVAADMSFALLISVGDVLVSTNEVGEGVTSGTMNYGMLLVFTLVLPISVVVSASAAVTFHRSRKTAPTMGAAVISSLVSCLVMLGLSGSENLSVFSLVAIMTAVHAVVTFFWIRLMMSRSLVTG